jgi:hypothetical protein
LAKKYLPEEGKKEKKKKEKKENHQFCPKMKKTSKSPNRQIIISSISPIP